MRNGETSFSLSYFPPLLFWLKSFAQAKKGYPNVGKKNVFNNNLIKEVEGKVENAATTESRGPSMGRLQAVFFSLLRPIRVEKSNKGSGGARAPASTWCRYQLESACREPDRAGSPIMIVVLIPVRRRSETATDDGGLRSCVGAKWRKWHGK